MNFNTIKKYGVDKGLNLYIDITTACNASCDFCIAPTIGRTNGKGFIPGLEFALGFTHMHNGSIQIVGGEPMISSRLIPTLNRISCDEYHRIVLNTNGTFVTQEKVLAAANAGVHHINISRHHFDENKNQEIMQMKPFLSNTELADVIAQIKDAGIAVRLNCNLISGYIDSHSMITEYIEWAKSIGVDTVSLSQIFPLGLFDYQAPPTPGYTESVQVDLPDVVKSLDNDTEYAPMNATKITERSSPWGGGPGGNWSTMSTSDNPHGKRRYWDHKGSIVSLKTLSGYDVNTGLPNPTSYNKNEDPELQNDIYFIVLHADGMVTASWDKRERILFNPYDPICNLDTIIPVALMSQAG